MYSRPITAINSELDEEAREVLDKEHIAQLDGMKEIERESQIAQLVEEKSIKKKQQQLKALAISSKEKGKDILQSPQH